MNNTINPSFRIRKKSKSKSVTNGIKLNKIESIDLEHVSFKYEKIAEESQ